MLALTEENAVGEILNIASGNAITINKIVQILQKIMDKKNQKPVYDKPREGDIRLSFASIEKVRAALRYEPEFSLETGLRRLFRTRN